MSGAITAGTLATVAGIGAAGSIGGALIGSNAAGKAASAQSDAANRAADLQSQASQKALDFQKQQYDTSQKQLAPFLQAGTGAVNNLSYLVDPNATATGNQAQLGSAGSLLTPYSKSFSAPTAQDLQQNDPGYQARLDASQQALQQSAAARGSLLTGGTAQALGRDAQDYASNEYGNYYNRAYNTYAQGYNQFQTGQANTFNRLAALTGTGQATAGNLAQIGQGASNNVTSNLLGTAGAMGNAYQNAGAANASGYVGSANALGGAVSNTGSNLSSLYGLSQMLKGSSQAPSSGPGYWSGAGFGPGVQPQPLG